MICGCVVLFVVRMVEDQRSAEIFEVFLAWFAKGGSDRLDLRAPISTTGLLSSLRRVAYPESPGSMRTAAARTLAL